MATPFFKGNYGSALARVDTRPIIEAGKAQGAMYANLGNEVAGAIKQYGLNKQERAKLTGEIEQDIMQYGEQLTMTGNEEFDKKNSSAIEKFRRGDSNMTDLRGLSGQIARMKLNVVEEQARDTANMQRQLNQAQLGKIRQDNTLTQAQLDKLNAENARQAIEEENLESAFGEFDRTVEEAQQMLAGGFDPNNFTPNVRRLLDNPALRLARTPEALAFFSTDPTKDATEKAQGDRMIAEVEKAELEVQELRGRLERIPEDQKIARDKILAEIKNIEARTRGAIEDQLASEDDRQRRAALTQGQSAEDTSQPIISVINPVDAFQGDIGGTILRGAAAIGGQFGKNVAPETKAQGQNLKTLGALLTPALLAQISSRPSNFSLQKIDEILPKLTDDVPTGLEKIKKMIPTLQTRLNEAKRTVQLGKMETEYFMDAYNQSKLLPSLIDSLKQSITNYDNPNEGTTSNDVGYNIKGRR